MFLINGVKVQLFVYLLVVVEFQSSWSQYQFAPEKISVKCIKRANSDNIKIQCESKQKIIIHEAFFATSSTARKECPFTGPPYGKSPSKTLSSWPTPCMEDLRLSFNYKCSGNSECEFNLNEHHNSKCLGDGFTVIRYVCIKEFELKKTCNLKLKAPYGYVATPGYPDFYPQLNCSWMIEGEEGQRIQLSILDTNIKDPTIIGYDEDFPLGFRKIPRLKCTDTLTIYEGGKARNSLCGTKQANLVQYVSNTNVVNVTFAGHEFKIARGVLFRYSLQGCPSLPPPQNGHLLYRNDSIAVYSCCDDHVFEDSRETTRMIYCSRGIDWNVTFLPPCIPVSALESTTTADKSTMDTSNYLPREQKSSQEEHYFSDILIPVLLMSFLIIANAFIVWILIRYKRKQKIRRAKEAAMAPLNSPTDV